MLFLFPAAFLIGGTLPVMSQFIARNISRMSRKVSILYAVNILGAGVGVLVAGFCLPIWLVVQAAYLVAVSITVLIGLSAIFISRAASLNKNIHLDSNLSINQSIHSNEYLTSGKLGLVELTIPYPHCLVILR